MQRFNDLMHFNSKLNAEKHFMQQLLIKLKINDNKAQEEVYKTYADRMFITCFRYVNNEDDAAEILNTGFYKAFCNVQNTVFENNIAFECWLRKIMINESLMFLRKTKRMTFANIQATPNISPVNEQHFSEHDYLKLLQALPEGYRTVFNLYAIEGYDHSEIAEMLDISESTSRSQLSRAREMLKRLIEKEL
jgi:RNA polymerase sigma factor (sigma-70 family)